MDRHLELEWDAALVDQHMVLRSFHTLIVRDVSVITTPRRELLRNEAEVFLLRGSSGTQSVMLNLLLRSDLGRTGGSWEVSGKLSGFLGAAPKFALA